MIITIDDYGTAEITIQEGEIKVKKKVTLFALAEVFSSLIKQERYEEVTPKSLLPQNTVFYAENQKGFFTIGLTWGPATLPFVFEGQLYPCIPFPKLIFAISGFRTDDELLPRSVKVAALKEGDRIGKDTVLYHYPLMHVSSNFSMCTGTVQLESIPAHEPDRWEALIRTILTSPNKNELYHPENNTYNMDARSLLEYLSGKECFPEEILVPSKFLLKDFMLSQKI